VIGLHPRCCDKTWSEILELKEKQIEEKNNLLNGRARRIDKSDLGLMIIFKGGLLFGRLIIIELGPLVFVRWGERGEERRERGKGNRWEARRERKKGRRKRGEGKRGRLEGRRERGKRKRGRLKGMGMGIQGERGVVVSGEREEGRGEKEVGSGKSED